MTRKETLERAAECVCTQREQDYGAPEDNFAFIAELRERYLRRIVPAHAESDYLREDIDRRLRQIMKDDAAPWSARYFGWSE